MKAGLLRRLAPRPESAAARRARTLRRSLRYATRQPTARGAICVGFYWWDGFKNFGDALTPWLLARYGVAPILTQSARAQGVGVGSILEHLPTEFAGITWGTGSLYGLKLNLPSIRPLALRGHLTRELLGITDRVYVGEPGILVSRHLPRRRPRYALGIVPHHAHEQNEKLQTLVANGRGSVRLISTRTSPSRAIRQIAECETIISSSLHGLVTADSFGIPALWFTAEPGLMGGTFKFHDYESVFTPKMTRQRALADIASVRDARRLAKTLDPDRVEEVCQELESSVEELKHQFRRQFRRNLSLWTTLLSRRPDLGQVG